MKDPVSTTAQQSPYPDWHYQPLRLLKDEIANPIEVVKEFFSGYTLPQWRKHFKEMLEDAMCAVEVYSVNYLTLYDAIEKLVEAAWLLLQSQRKEGINSAVKSGGESLSSILQLITAAMQPERIFLLSHKEGQLIDLLIVMPDTSAKPFNYYEAIITTVCCGIAEVSFSLHLSSRLEKQVSEGHPFYRLVCTEDKLVYSAEGTAVPLPSSGSQEEFKAKAQQQFNLGFARSETFFESAKGSLESGDVATAMFFLHQSAELSLRALIRSLSGNEVKEHSLGILAKHIRRFSPALAALFAPSQGEERERILLLESAYLKGRYSDSFSPSGEDLLQLFGWVQDLRESCEKTFLEAWERSAS